MPFIHYVQNPPQFTCPGCGWALTDADPAMLSGDAPLKCKRCGWEHPAENLLARSGDALDPQPGASLDLGEGVSIEIPQPEPSDSGHTAHAVGVASLDATVIRADDE